MKPIPPAVVEYFQSDAYEVLAAEADQKTVSGQSPLDFSDATSFGVIREIYSFTSYGESDGDTSRRFDSLSEWVAVIETDQEPVGILAVFIPPASDSVQFAWLNNDISLAVSIDKLQTQGARLIVEPSAGMWMALQDEVVVPLNERARLTLGEQSSIEDVHSMILAQRSDAINRSQGASDSVGGGAAGVPPAFSLVDALLVGGGLLLVLLGTAGMVLLSRRRRAH